MSEERFVVGSNDIGEIIVTDVETDRVYRYDSAVDFFGLIRLLNEQQSTITKLKELNGDKGKRIISLIRTNKTLKEENEQLRGINKEIGDDLYNCRLNKDIVSEKLKLWQDTLAEYDIYTIKDFKELMKNDN